MAGPARHASAQGIPFSTSPVLAVRLPAWRSRFVLFFLFLAFAALIGRAFWLQGMSTEFLQKQGESRYAHAGITGHARQDHRPQRPGAGLLAAGTRGMGNPR